MVADRTETVLGRRIDIQLRAKARTGRLGSLAVVPEIVQWRSVGCQLFACRCRKHDSAWWAKMLQTGRDIDAISKNIAALKDHLTEIDAHSKGNTRSRGMPSLQDCYFLCKATAHWKLAGRYRMSRRSHLRYSLRSATALVDEGSMTSCRNALRRKWISSSFASIKRTYPATSATIMAATAFPIVAWQSSVPNAYHVANWLA